MHARTHTHMGGKAEGGDGLFTHTHTGGEVGGRWTLQTYLLHLLHAACADVPDVLLRISQPHLHKILESLASRDKWRQMEVVVNKARANDIPRGQFARNMSILALVRDGGLCGAEAQRLQVRPGGR